MRFNLSRRGVLGGILGAIAGCFTGSLVQASAMLGPAVPDGAGASDTSTAIEDTWHRYTFDKNSELVSTQIETRQGKTITITLYNKRGELISRRVEYN